MNDAIIEHIYTCIDALESIGQSRAVVFISGDNAEGKLFGESELPAFYQCLKSVGRTSCIDFVLGTDGGQVNSVHRLAKFFRSHTNRIRMFVPRKARSAGTLLCLAGNEIVLGPLGELGPVDPVLNLDRGNSNGPRQISSEEIKAFRLMIADWFGMKGSDARRQALGLLCDKIFPTTLSAFYRAELYVCDVGSELLLHHLPTSSKKTRLKIMQHLVSGYSFHHHGLVVDDLVKIGLRARSTRNEEETILENIWQAARKYLDRSRDRTAEENVDVAGLLISRGFAARYVRKLPAISKLTSDVGARELTTIVRQASSNNRWETLSGDKIF